MKRSMSFPDDSIAYPQTTHGVLVLSEVRGDTRRYRALHLVDQLRLLGIPCRFVQMADPQARQIASQPWAIAIFHRVSSGYEAQKILRGLRDAGTLILADFDDLIFDVSAFPYINSPDFADPVRVKLYKENMMNIRQMLEQCEGSLASTEFLAGRIRQEGKPAWVHRNAFSLEMLAYSETARRAKRAKVGERVVIGYASGTPTHNQDFALVKPALLEILKRYPQAELRLIGPLEPGNDWGALAEQVSRYPLVPWRKLPDLLVDLDINIAPLRVENPFSQSKSEIKYMEAAMVEVPTVASPTEAFRLAMRSGETGILASDTGEWVDALSALINNPELRNTIARQAYEEVIKMYHPACRAGQLADTLESMTLHLHGESFWRPARPTQDSISLQSDHYSDPGSWLPKGNEQAPSLIQMGLYSLRNRGVITLISHMWIYFRRLISPLIPFRERK